MTEPHSGLRHLLRQTTFKRSQMKQVSLVSATRLKVGVTLENKLCKGNK